MFGIDDPAIYLAYLLSFICLIGCAIYGIANWNKGHEPDTEEIQEEIEWEKEEETLTEEL